MRKLVAGVCALTVLASTAWAGDPVGRYQVQGTNPDGGGAYSGTATVEKTGDTYRVTWNVEGDRYTGTAIGNEKFIAVSYRSREQSGLALYGAEGDGWEGIWAYSGGNQLGAEKWTRR
jgi:hypothetical protein